jgi:WD40 repeat protein
VLPPRWQANVEDHVVDLAWTMGGELLAAASVSGPIAVWQARSGAAVSTLSGHGFGTMSIAWQPHAAILASAGQDGAVRLWNAASGQAQAELAGGAAWVSQVRWCPVQGGKRPPRLAAAAGRAVRFWTVDGQLEREYANHPSTVADIQWHKRRNELAIAAYGVLILCNPDRPDDLRLLRWQGSSLVIAWSPDGRYLATGDQDSTVHFWITATGEDLQMWGYPTKVRELSWDGNSRYLATGGGSGVTVWDCSGKGPAGSKPIQLEAHDAPLTVLAYQHHGSLLASAGEDGLVAIWAPDRLKRPVCRVQLDTAVSCLGWSPDDRRLAVGCADGSLRVYELVTG